MTEMVLNQGMNLYRFDLRGQATYTPSNLFVRLTDSLTREGLAL